jgi:hypothetical protein
MKIVLATPQGVKAAARTSTPAVLECPGALASGHRREKPDLIAGGDRRVRGGEFLVDGAADLAIRGEGHGVGRGGRGQMAHQGCHGGDAIR